MSQKNKHFLHPRYWSGWLLIAFFRVVAWLPWGLQKAVAWFLGSTLFYLARERRHIVDVNLRLCFPQWDAATRRQKTREVFLNNAMGLVETANGYYLSPEKLRSMVDIRGLDKLEAALARGKGVLLLGAHYSHLDLGGALISLAHPIYCIYRPHNNPLMDRYIIKNRQKFLKGLVERRDMRGILRALKNNGVVWYPPDQDYGGKHSVYAPFFGVNAATITATSRLAKINDSPILTISYRRDGNRQHYFLDIEEFDPSFPTGDDVEDATLVNRALETMIRRAPTQYMWTHRRFKSQPDAKGALYK